MELLHSFSATEYTESTELCRFSLCTLCSLWFFKPDDNKKSPWSQDCPIEERSDEVGAVCRDATRQKQLGVGVFQYL